MSASGDTAPLITVMPNMSTEKPSSVMPISLRLCFFDIISMAMPISAINGANDSGFRSLRNGFALSLIPESESTHAVSVVPICEPSMAPVV